ncbi:tyrosine/serine/threonine protein phosphatase pps1 [Mortierella antarctica]|nr:tyrosine/serine/threonine protein phosphatase pps1 [Mortierella antarctica]
MVATAIPLEGQPGILTAAPFPSAPTGADSASPANPAVLSYPLINTQPPIRAINADQLFQLHQRFIATPLPSEAMFPWLHGVDGSSSPQNYFFGLEPYPFSGLAMEPDPPGDHANPRLPLPEHRGLMLIHASDLDTGRLVGSVSPSEILQRTTVEAQSAALSSVTNNHPTAEGHTNTNYDINNHPQMLHQYSAAAVSACASTCAHEQQQPDHAQEQHPFTDATSSEWADISDDSVGSSSLSSSSLSSTISSSFNHPTSHSNTVNNNSDSHHPYSNTHPRGGLQASFIHSLSEGINIRNFKIQVPRYALLSDIVIYAKEGEQDLNLLQLAKLISVAQDEVWQTMRELHPQQVTVESRRQTLVLIDTFAAFEAKYPEMVSISGTGKVGKNKVDFWEQEREQMSLLTRASEIAPGIWLGNNLDVPLTNTGANSLATPVSPGSSFSSYFFPPLASIPNTLDQDKSSAIPNTPPPDESEYPPLTPPSFNDHSNFQPSICVECRSGANFPTTLTLDRIRNNVHASPAPLSAKEIFHLECLGTLAAGLSPDMFPPSTSSLSSFARPSHADVQSTHAMRRATAAELVRGPSQVSNATLQSHISHLLNMAFFIQSVISPNKSTSSPTQQQHQVLIHCVDGYTETALLALCVVMIHYELSLAEAYVKLQTELGRSFFVYPNDAIVMLEVESQVWHRILLERTERDASAKLRAAAITATVSGSVEIGSTTTVTSTAISAVPPTSEEAQDGMSGSTPTSGVSSLSSSMSSYSSTFFASLLNMSNQPSQDQPSEQPQPMDKNGNLIPPSFSATSSNDTDTTMVTTTAMTTTTMMEGIEPMPDRDQELAIQRPFVQPGHEDKFGWFYHPEFEGSFPSRILPFLYLGNLAHASNPGLLKSLGIRYVLSVGEEAHGLLDAELLSVNNEGNNSNNSNKDAVKGKNTSKNNNNNTGFMVKFVDDMFDNGVDSLWKHIENCVDFVDEARRSNSRVLIHCRVGVSRSATIVIAYLMAHYHLSLVDAYLMVRARRLSVIIQPNLLFMYELLQWEQRLRGQFDPMGWPGIAREVHNLNMFYIGN